MAPTLPGDASLFNFPRVEIPQGQYHVLWVVWYKLYVHIRSSGLGRQGIRNSVGVRMWRSSGGSNGQAFGTDDKRTEALIRRFFE